MDKEMGKETANRILVNFKQTNMTDGQVSSEFQADLAEFFDKRKEARLTKMSFVEYNTLGAKNTEGKADAATIQTDRKDAQIAGQVYFFSLSEKTKLFAESLNWTDSEKSLRSAGNDTVTVERETGSSIQGRGFEVNFKSGVLNFTSGIKGSVVEKEKDEKPPSVPNLPNINLPETPQGLSGDLPSTEADPAAPLP